MRTILTATSCNNHYFEHALALLRSACRNANEQLTIGLINGDKIHEKAVHKIDKAINVLLYEIEGSSRFDYSRARFEVIRRTMEQGYKQICWMDCDIIIRGSISEFWEDLSPRSMKIVVRNVKSDRTKFQIGVVGFGVDSLMKCYITDIRDKLVNAEGWCEDQTEMYRVWKNYKYLIEIRKLSPKYNDSEFKNNSIVWHCKSSHFNEEKYQEEYRKYL